VGADVPDVQMIENISQDSTGKIRLQIRHANPNPGHYIDLVEIDVLVNIHLTTEKCLRPILFREKHHVAYYLLAALNWFSSAQ
jgi:hypothetical protein